MKTIESDRDKAWSACFRHLPKVSRTFALAIDGLPEPLRGEVCVAYLLCRILDTVEDAPGLGHEQRWDFISAVVDTLADRHPLPASWRPGVDQVLAPRSAQGDVALLRDGNLVLDAFWSCRTSARLATARWVTEMGKGMVLWSARMGEGQGVIKGLRTMADLDRYCYYIAGTVGYLLTDLFFIHSPLISQDRFYELQADAEAFGLGLQKVNIVKDLADDYRRGWCFVPSEFLHGAGLGPEDLADPKKAAEVYGAVRPILIAAASHLARAWHYVTLIPVEERQIRLFLAYSLFFALKTLALVALDPAALVAPRKLKISRAEVARIVAECQLKISRPAALEKAYLKAAAPLSGFLS